MKAQEKNDIIFYSINYSHIIKKGQYLKLDDYADLIEKHYDRKNPIQKEVCRWLRGTEGKIGVSPRTGVQLLFTRHKD